MYQRSQPICIVLQLLILGMYAKALQALSLASHLFPDSHLPSLKLTDSSAETLDRLFVQSANSVEQAVDDCLQQYGPEATIAVIPKGPYVLAEVE